MASYTLMPDPILIVALGASLGVNAALVPWLLGSLRQNTTDRSQWNQERNALLERLVPGSTPQPEPRPRAYIIGDDHQEWLLSLDDETRAQVELEERQGVLR